MKVEANEFVLRPGALDLVEAESKLEELRIVVWNWGSLEKEARAISEADRLSHRKYWNDLIKAEQAGVVCEVALDCASLETSFARRRARPGAFPPLPPP